ncbi:MAG: YciI family protein [Polyangiaceae bacterium]
MRFLMTYENNPNSIPTPEQMAAIGKFGHEMTQAGVLVMTGGLVRPSGGTKVKLEAGKFSVTDGPYAETKELIDGFAVIEVASKEEAVKVAEQFMRIAGDGQGEILQMFAPGGPPPR